MLVCGGVGVTDVFIFIGLSVLNILFLGRWVYSYKQQNPTQKLQYISWHSTHLSKWSTQTELSHSGQCSVYLESRKAGHFWQSTTVPVRKTRCLHPLMSFFDSFESWRHLHISLSDKYSTTMVRTLTFAPKDCHICAQTNVNKLQYTYVHLKQQQLAVGGCSGCSGCLQ